MSDRDFLKWIHQRLVTCYREDPECDYMVRLRQLAGTASDYTPPPVPGEEYRPRIPTGRRLP